MAWESFIATAKLGSILGALFGLVPLSVGLYRRRPKSALITFLACTVLGALFGFYGSLIFSLMTAATIWRGGRIKGASAESAPNS